MGATRVAESGFGLGLCLGSWALFLFLFFLWMDILQPLSLRGDVAG